MTEFARNLLNSPYVRIVALDRNGERFLGVYTDLSIWGYVFDFDWNLVYTVPYETNAYGGFVTMKPEVFTKHGYTFTESAI